MTEFYKTQWKGTFDGTDEELSLLLSRSCDIVDNAISFSGFTVRSVPEEFQTRVYKAVCSQADFITANGGIESLTESGYSSVSLGRFSYSADTSAENNPHRLCPLAYAYLAPTGFLYRGVGI